MGGRAAVIVDLGDDVLRAGDAFLAAMRRELKAVGDLPPHLSGLGSTVQGTSAGA